MLNTPYPSPFGTLLARLRREKCWRQDDLASRIGCKRAFISHLEIGSKQPSPQLIDELIVALQPTPEIANEIKEAAELSRGSFAFPTDMPLTVRREILRLVRCDREPSLGSWQTLASELAQLTAKLC